MSIAVYRTREVVRDFATRTALTPAEVAALGEVWPCVRGDLLDVGVGGGRTTGYLMGVARSYRALDISDEMIDACRSRFPGVDVGIGDARTLDGHADGSYDLVLFSFNGIDYVEFDERKSVLAACQRVLRPGGALVYSSHNLRVLGGRLPLVERPRIVPTLNPLRLAVRIGRAFRGHARRTRNRQRLADQQVLGDSYALVNDEAYDYSMLTVYVDPDYERAALTEAGFDGITTIDFSGRRNPAVLNDPWIYYVGRKPGAAKAPDA